MQLGLDLDCSGQGSGHRAPARVKRVSSLRGFALVVRAAPEVIDDADALHDEDPVLNHHPALSLGFQLALTRIDPARLQRAAQGSGQSTSGRGDQVVERCRMLGILPRCGSVVVAHRSVGAEDDRLVFGGQESAPKRTAVTDNADPRDVGGRLLTHCVPA